MAKLAIIVMGRMSAGKSKAWQTLFNKHNKIHRGWKKLDLGRTQYNKIINVHGSKELDVYLVVRAAKEESLSFEEIFNEKVDLGSVKILFGSVRYSEVGLENIDYLLNKGFNVKVIWLNPGYKVAKAYFDELGMAQRLLTRDIEVTMADGDSPRYVARQVREKVVGWAWHNP